MKAFHNQKGLTLIEIIVSIAILGIIVAAMLSMSTFGMTNLFFSGQKSEVVMDLQSAVDDLNAQQFSTTESQNARDGIISYLQEKGYYYVSDLSQLSVQVSGADTNFYVSESETKAETAGYTVTILKFIQSGKRSAELSTFLPDWGK
ncbi:MAG: prepilin-type N-terminal cleavage/methylation domain-containing protein [Oscillospiraceae bacterium]